MANRSKVKSALQAKRRRRVRSKIFGVSERPRLTVCKSIKHVYAQIVDDTVGRTLAHVSSTSKQLAGKLSAAKNKTDRAKIIGLAIAVAAKEKGITEVVFDRNQNRYHGRVRALAEGAREGGLKC